MGAVVTVVVAEAEADCGVDQQESKQRHQEPMVRRVGAACEPHREHSSWRAEGRVARRGLPGPRDKQPVPRRGTPRAHCGGKAGVRIKDAHIHTHTHTYTHTHTHTRLRSHTVGHPNRVSKRALLLSALPGNTLMMQSCWHRAVGFEAENIGWMI